MADDLEVDDEALPMRTQVVLLRRSVSELTRLVNVQTAANAQLLVAVTELKGHWDRAQGALLLARWVIGLLAAGGGLLAFIKARLPHG
jgi:hypothetical protein